MGDLKDTIKKRLENPDLDKVVREIARRWEECSKKGHPNRTYLHSSNSGRDDLMYDTYQCSDCGHLIKEYNPQKTLGFRESFRRPTTI